MARGGGGGTGGTGGGGGQQKPPAGLATKANTAGEAQPGKIFDTVKAAVEETVKLGVDALLAVLDNDTRPAALTGALVTIGCPSVFELYRYDSGKVNEVIQAVARRVTSPEANVRLAALSAVALLLRDLSDSITERTKLLVEMQIDALKPSARPEYWPLIWDVAASIK